MSLLLLTKLGNIYFCHIIKSLIAVSAIVHVAVVAIIIIIIIVIVTIILAVVGTSTNTCSSA
jgi:hypothetical protein